LAGHEPGQGRRVRLSGSLIVEADGRAWHTREQEFVADRQRDNTAAATGHTTLRFTWIDLVQYPAESLSIVRRTVGSRATPYPKPG
jgi:very-short-patch-repair endonuclease